MTLRNFPDHNVRKLFKGHRPQVSLVPVADGNGAFLRHRDKGDLGAMPFEQFADVVVREIAERHISPMI